jgi:hypothetical protein
MHKNSDARIFSEAECVGNREALIGHVEIALKAIMPKLITDRIIEIIKKKHLPSRRMAM